MLNMKVGNYLARPINFHKPDYFMLLPKNEAKGSCRLWLCDGGKFL